MFDRLSSANWLVLSMCVSNTKMDSVGFYYVYMGDLKGKGGMENAETKLQFKTQEIFKITRRGRVNYYETLFSSMKSFKSKFCISGCKSDRVRSRNKKCHRQTNKKGHF